MYLASELSQTRRDMGILSAERDSLTRWNKIYQGDKEAVNKLNLQECEDVEKQIRHTNEMIEYRKVIRIKQVYLFQLEINRFCYSVICRS